MASEHFETRIEEQILTASSGQKVSSTGKVTHNAVKTSRDLCKEQNFDES